MKKISNKTRFIQKRGQGDGKDYKPWIRGREFNSAGTVSCPIDWKTGRIVECASQGEMEFYYITRFDDRVVDIKEQYPLLPIRDAMRAAEELGLNYPRIDKGEPAVMTTDFLILLNNGKQLAVSFKNSRNDITKERLTLEKLNIEKQYWKNKNVEYQIFTKDDLDFTYANNIRVVVQYYNIPKNMLDDITIVKHLISRKIITVDLFQKGINYKELSEKYGKEIELWKKQNTYQTQRLQLEQ